jgi:Ca2+-binding RTX toxin-like protein
VPGPGNDVIAGAGGYDIILARGAGADAVDGGKGTDVCVTDSGDTVTNCP